MPTVGDTRVGAGSGSLSYGSTTGSLAAGTVAASTTPTTSGLQGIAGVNIGVGAGVFAGETGGSDAVTLNFKSIIGAGGLSVSTTADTITLTASGGGGAGGAGTFESLLDGPGNYSPGSLLVSGSSSVGWTPLPSAPGQALIWDGAALGYGVLNVKADNNLVVTGNAFSPSTGMVIGLKPTGVVAYTYNAPTLTIDQYGRVTSASSNSSLLTGVANIGTGQPILSGIFGNTAQFKSLVAGNGVTLNASPSTLTISTTPAVTSVSAQGNSDISVTGGTITSTGTLVFGLLPTGVAPGTYANATVTVDVNGRVVAISGGTASGGGSVSISAVGFSNNRGVVDVAVSGSPVTSNGTLGLSLTQTGVLSSGNSVGTFVRPTLVVDAQGRIIGAASDTSTPGTVSRVEIDAGNGITVTGNAITGNGSYTVGLANVANVAGNYTSPNLTVDSTGRVVAISNGTLSGGTPTTVVGGVGITVVPANGTYTVGLAAPTASAVATYTNATISVDAYGRVTAGSSGAVSTGTSNSGSTVFQGGYGVTVSASAGTYTFAATDGAATAGTYPLANVTIDGHGKVSSVVAGTAPTHVITGDVSGTGSTAIVLTLAAVGTAGTYTKVVTDSKGRVTSGSTLASGDVTTALGFTPAGLVSPVFTGTPAAPTPATADNTTKVATTAYVQAQGYRTANQTIAVTGDATGSGATAIALTLANSGVTAGTYTYPSSVVVDAKGRVTSIVAGVAGSAGTSSSTPAIGADTYCNLYYFGPLNVPAGTGGVLVPVGVDKDTGGNTTGGGTANFAYNAKRGGQYRLRAMAQFLNTGTAANSSSGTPAAPPMGTDYGIIVGTPFNANPVYYKPTGPNRNFVLYETDLYLNQGNALSVSAYSDAATALLFVSASIIQIA